MLPSLISSSKSEDRDESLDTLYLTAIGKLEKFQSGVFILKALWKTSEQVASSTFSDFLFNILGFEITELNVLFNFFLRLDFTLLSETPSII